MTTPLLIRRQQRGVHCPLRIAQTTKMRTACAGCRRYERSHRASPRITHRWPDSLNRSPALRPRF